MSVFYHKKDRTNPLPAAAGAGLVLLLGLLLSSGMDRMSRRADLEEKASLEQAVASGIAQYYAIEGQYPEHIGQVQEMFGFSWEDSRYLVDYRPVGANLMPDVTILEKGGTGYGEE